jgi:hypothetical protein
MLHRFGSFRAHYSMLDLKSPLRTLSPCGGNFQIFLLGKMSNRDSTEYEYELPRKNQELGIFSSTFFADVTCQPKSASQGFVKGREMAPCVTS